MQYTTPTEIVEKGSKVFEEYQQAVVLQNDEPIWILFGWDLAQVLMENDVITQLREELWELNDEETNSMVVDYRNNWLSEDSISFSDFKKEHDL